MQLLDLGNAKHFADGFNPNSVSENESARTLTSGSAIRGTFLEGTPTFEKIRATLLREADRRLAMAASSYRRAHDMMHVSSAPWGHTTLYYASFYAATAAMAALGAWVHPKRMIHVAKRNAGVQELEVLGAKATGGMSTFNGSHESTWDLFYQGFQPLKQTIPNEFQAAITPVHQLSNWQPRARNKATYQAEEWSEHWSLFEDNFDPAKFPGCLAGDLSTQYQVTRCTVGLAFHISRLTRLSTDGLDGHSRNLTRKQTLHRALTARPASMGTYLRNNKIQT
jgi:hypothetical protein